MVSLENRLVHFESSNAFFSTFNICFCLNWLRRGSSVKGKSCLIFYKDLVIGTGDAGMVSLIITVRDISMFWGYYKFFFSMEMEIRHGRKYFSRTMRSEISASLKLCHRANVSFNYFIHCSYSL